MVRPLRVCLPPLVLCVLGLSVVPLGAVAGMVVAPVEAQVLTSEGVAGDVDRSRRGPSLSVSTRYTGPIVQILADAFVPNPQFARYPVEFQFFVNRTLRSTQLRSPELPGPVGIEVATKETPLPFNYSVVATVLHPNRHYTTVINGAAFAADLIGTFDCTLTRGADEAAEVFTAEEVTTSQSGNGTFTLSFTAEDAESDATASVSAEVSVSGNEAMSTLAITAGGIPSTVPVSGKVVLSEGQLTELALSSSDGNTTISCS